jgi:hypothetical protein
MFKQHLTKTSKSYDIGKIVSDMAGLHAQIPATPYLSLFARVDNFSRDMLESSLYEERSIGRIRCLRNTVFIIPREFIDYFMSATRKNFELSPDKYTKYIGLTIDEFNILSKSIVKTIGDKGLTAKEIRKRIKGDGSISRVLSLMCDQGILARGKPPGWRSSAYEYHSFEDFYGKINYRGLDGYESKKFVVKSYLKSYGPVSKTDVIWWTGFNKGDIKKILHELIEKNEAVLLSEGGESLYMEIEDRRKFEQFESDNNTIINILPAMDSYIMGYKNRSHILDNDLWNYIFDRNGNATSTVCLNGRVAGIWDFDKKAGMKLYILQSIDDCEMEHILEEVRRTGTFLECGENIKIYEKMIPVRERTAGGFMSPLKD